MPFTIDGVVQGPTVIVKKPGDVFENVTPGATKTVDSAAFSTISSGITVDSSGTVVIDPVKAQTPITYNVHVETQAAYPGLQIDDTLGQYLEFVDGSGGAQLTTWDENGLNRTVTPLAAPTVTAGSTTFSYTTDLPANSVLDVTYKARIAASELAALQADLQAKYDAVKTTGGAWQATLANGAVIGTFNGGQPSQATGTVGGSVAGPWTPDLGAFWKNAWLTDGPQEQWVETVANAQPWEFTEPVRVTWRLFSGLSQWNASTPERTLTQNVVISDTLVAGQDWDVADANVVTLYNENTGALIPLTEATGITLDELHTDAYVDHYLIDGKTLHVNVGKTPRDVSVRAIAVVTSNPAPAGQNWFQNGGWIYRLANTASWDWSAGDDIARSANLDLRSTPEGPTTDTAYFTKTTANASIEFDSGDNAWVPYQFLTPSAMAAKLSDTVIVDYIDHNVFDVTEDNLDEIRATITSGFTVGGQNYHSNIGWSVPFSATDWDLSLDGDGNLVLQPSATLKTWLAANPGWDSTTWRLAIQLPTKQVDGTQTLQLTNRASLQASTTETDFVSRTESYASTWGDELEVRKSVWDAVNQQWTTSLRVPLTDEDELTQDTFTYRVQAMPHGDYANVTIIPIKDVLPDGVEFVGFADGPTGGTTTGTKLLAGNLQASYDDATGTVTIQNQPGTLLSKQPSIDTFIRVKVVDFTPDVGITNIVSGNPATIVPTNDYPLNVLKKDSENPTKAITDASARFEVRDSTGALVATAQVKDGVLVVPDGNGGTKALTVAQPGTYTITETKAPVGYAATTEVYTVVSNADGSSTQVVINNTPAVDYALGDKVWIDANRDGLQGSDELPLAGVTVTLLDGSGTPVAGKTTTTDADGRYLFDNLPAGDYQVRFTLTDAQAAQYVFTTANASATDPASKPDPTDSDAVVGTDSKVATTPVFTLGAGNPALTKTYTDQSFTATRGIDPTWDAGVVLNKVSIGDFVWWDADRDGLQDADEQPIEGLQVQLHLGDALVGTTTTDADGYYFFKDLSPSTEYTVTFGKPDGDAVFFTTQNAGGVTDDSPSGDVDDSDADPATGEAEVTTPAAGFNRSGHGEADNPGIDAGFVRYNLSIEKRLTTAGPFVPGMEVTYELTPHNDGPVAALAGWSVTDVLPTSMTLVSISGDGYTCTPSTQNCVASAPLAPGADGPIVTVVAKVGASFTGTAKNVAYVTPSAEDVDETNPLEVPTLGTKTGETPTDNDTEAKLTVPQVSIGDYVWFDTNRDGVQGSSEPVAAGVTVNLYRNGAKVGTTETDTEGYYWFADLLPQTEYTVEFVKPEGTSFTTRNASGVTSNDPSADGADSDADPADGKVTFTTPVSGQNLGGKLITDNPGIDAGLVKYNLKLTKTRTSSEVVYKGDTVTFTLTPSNEGPVDALAGWSVTEVLPAELTLVSMSGDGYAFDAATNTVTNGAVLPAGATAKPITVVATVTKNLTGDVKNVAYVNPAQGDGPETNPLGTPPSDTTVDTSTTPTDNDAEAPVKGASLVSLGDYVWIDVDRDGQQDDGHPVEGVVVNLYAANGTTLLASTTTNAEGFYSFGDLRPGTEVVVEFIRPDGYAFTVQDDGADATDSDADRENGRVHVTTPAAGGNSITAPDDPTIDAGLVRFNLTLEKEITSSGPYYEGWTVTFELTPHNDGPADALGGWSVVELPEEGLKITAIDGGDSYDCDVDTLTCVNPRALAAGADAAPITVTAVVAKDYVGDLHNVAYVVPAEGDVAETNPLERPADALVDTRQTPTDNDDAKKIRIDSLVSVGDYVWWDHDRDGVQGEAEPSVPGVTVNLLDAEGEVLRSTTTDGSGYYAFDDLVPGRHYTIEFVKPEGASFTLQNALEDDASDSDADVVTGRVDFVAAEAGENRVAPGEADDPTIDAGLVTYDLAITKDRVGTGDVEPGDTVTFAITPRNEGPSDVLAGWSVEERLPSGLTLVSITGEGYACEAARCTALEPLAAGKDGAEITVVARVGAGVTGELVNVAVVHASPDDVPEPDTTNNKDDAQVISVAKPLAITGTTVAWGLAGVAVAALLAGIVLLLRRARTARD